MDEPLHKCFLYLQRSSLNELRKASSNRKNLKMESLFQPFQVKPSPLSRPLVVRSRMVPPSSAFNFKIHGAFKDGSFRLWLDGSSAGGVMSFLQLLLLEGCQFEPLVLWPETAHLILK